MGSRAVEFYFLHQSKPPIVAKNLIKVIKWIDLCEIHPGKLKQEIVMLDLDHHQTEHIFRASGLKDAVMKYGQEMSVSPSSVRFDLLTKCTPLFERMRSLAADHFAPDADHIISLVNDYERAITDLANLSSGQITEDHRDGEGYCPVCGTRITRVSARVAGFSDIIVCRTCSEPYMEFQIMLAAPEAFATMFI